MRWVDTYLRYCEFEPIVLDATFNELLVPYMTRTDGKRPAMSTVNGWEGKEMINLNPKRVGPLNFYITNDQLRLPQAPQAPVVTSVKWYKNKLYLCGATVCTGVVLGATAYYKLKEWGFMGGKSRRHKRKHNNKTKRNKK
jgi:hypothetical protein